MTGSGRQRPAFARVFAEERRERLLWFCRLRWAAVAGLATASVLGPSFGAPAFWPALLVVAVFVAAYNVTFLVALHRRPAAGNGSLGRFAITQIVFDLAALLVAVYFTGSLQSPLLGFFAFHMAIGTIMIRTAIMYRIAGLTWLATAGLYVLENRGVFPTQPWTAAFAVSPELSRLNLMALAMTLFGIVYLTDTVTSRFKKRSIELYATSEELRRKTGALRQALEQMEAVERRKSHYMRISAHQLRSPLGTIRTTLDVLTQGYVDPASERGQRLLAGAIERVDALLAIVNDLLELAKIREGSGRAPWVEDVNLNQLLADLLDALTPKAEARNIRLVPEFRGVAVLPRGVPPDLVYAFENLVDNAIKYSPPGGEVTVRLRIEDDEAVIEVQDRGIGIPDDLLDDVFLEFVRAPNAKRYAPEGTGLGLPIAREAVALHGGELTVQSTVGQGTVFSVRLPLDRAKPSTARFDGG